MKRLDPATTDAAAKRRAARAKRPTDVPTDQPTEERTMRPTVVDTGLPAVVDTDEPSYRQPGSTSLVRALSTEAIRAKLADGSVVLEPADYDSDGNLVEDADGNAVVDSLDLVEDVAPSDGEVVATHEVPRRDDDPVHPEVVDDAAVAGQRIAAEHKAKARRRRQGRGLLDLQAFDDAVQEVAGRPRPRGGVSPVNVAVSAVLADRLDAYVSAHKVAHGSRLSKREVVELLLDELLGDPR